MGPSSTISTGDIFDEILVPNQLFEDKNEVIYLPSRFPTGFFSKLINFYHLTLWVFVENAPNINIYFFCISALGIFFYTLVKSYKIMKVKMSIIWLGPKLIYFFNTCPSNISCCG